MRFIDRSRELKTLSEIKKLSREKFWILAVMGMRRVGKTRLILEFMKDKGIYFFVNKNKSNETLLREFSGLLKEKKITGKLEVINTWDEFFEVLTKRYSGIVVFDEFQNFSSVDKSVYGTLQKTFDVNEDRPVMMILSGSIVGLLKKTFQGKKEPLYGRVKSKINLKPLDFFDVIEAGNELGFRKLEDVISLYSLFGGFPRYYVTIEDQKLHGKGINEILDSLFFEENAVLGDEVQVILSQEFGGRSGVYYSILEAIANGSNSLSEIAGYLGRSKTSITRHMTELHRYFEILRLERPLIKGRKKGLYFINHPLIHFWFKFFYKNYSLYEKRDPKFIQGVKEQLSAFVGFRFEELCRETIIERLREKLPFEPMQVGKQWGKIPGGEVYEIDIVALNKEKAFFIECKWKDLKYNAARDVIEKLKEKSQYVQYNGEAFFGLIAKKIQGKERLRGEGIYAWDIRDFK